MDDGSGTHFSGPESMFSSSSPSYYFFNNHDVVMVHKYLSHTLFQQVKDGSSLSFWPFLSFTCLPTALLHNKHQHLSQQQFWVI